MFMKSNRCFHPITAIFVVACIALSLQGYGAFVPATPSPAHEKQERIQKNMWLQLALMRTEDMEAALGKKLSFREKIALLHLRKKSQKQFNQYIASAETLDDDCFTMYLKNGEVLEVKLIQINQKEIKYQRCNKPGDPEIIISKSEVFSIKDKSGELIYSLKNESWKKDAPMDTQRIESLSLASGIVGIGSVTLGLLYGPLGLAAGITAFILGLISLKRYRSSKEARGEGWAITGVVTGGLWLLFTFLVLVALAALW
jgi:hypothetical protein